MNLKQSIVRDIENNGPISFARFMELALYAPALGYYEQKGRVGRAGDFYTSVSVGCLFGELLAAQFSQCLAQYEATTPLHIVECGANDGQLALDILEALRRCDPKLGERIRYGIIEPSPTHQAWQQEKLQNFPHAWWAESWDDVEAFTGIVFSNELLDAMPFHRISWNKQLNQWMELKVSWTVNREFFWVMDHFSGDRLELPFVPSELAEVLPDGFTTEISPAASLWWQSAAEKLKQGKLVAIDYGITGEQLLSPERSRGTARAYFKHHLVEDLLANPGDQDITSHINFSAIIAAGEAAGLKTEFFDSQAKFLTQLLSNTSMSAAQWDRKRLAQFQTLTHPSHLGTRFKVVVQSR